MIKYRGLVEKEIAGKKMFFKFNMAAIIELGDITDLGASGLLTEGSKAKLSVLTAFLYAGALQYWKSEHKTSESKFKEPWVYTVDDAAEWFAELGLQPVLTMFLNCFRGPEYEEKNEVATTEETGVSKTLSDSQSLIVA